MLALRKTPAVRLGLAGRTLYIAYRNPRRGLSGLGAMVHGVDLEVCDQTSVASQYACSVRNQDLINASYDEHPGSYLGGGVYAQTPQAAAIYGGSYYPYASISTPAPAPVTVLPSPPVRTYQPAVSFSTSRGGATAYPGDTWRVSISGGAPNAAVTVTGGKGGAMDTSSMGSTDGAGSYSKTGTFGAGEVGNWFEQWSVGGTPAGSFSFVVTAAPVAPPPTGGGAPPPGGGAPPPTGGPDPRQEQPAGSGFDLQGLLTGKAFFGLPNWVWVAGAGGLFLFRGRGGR